ncbi:DUF4450 domain-containing protein [Aestuariibaculum lutulentum]|uniref:DUF4450 domain-containing protein n=1 Tax=Aestuariibaculum lutulentum TaxID=2920935 RepID=A0ABS9RFK8_9FLAO|nr:DUF4450 domain-containing protein [Aestuariibaculum lutulentum]MCH4551723.1 DUF4450 domain-containing protein [Aestuariibaculum lutulentum]
MNVFKSKIIHIGLCFFVGVLSQLSAQENSSYQSTSRKIHYLPEGENFILKNGTRKFNRALYGTNTGFRVEAGDLPEFAMYMPGMGGNFRLGIISETSGKWLTESDFIVSKYIPGTMIYEVRDEWLHNGIIKLEVAAHAENEGMLLKVETENIPESIQLVWAFGGATGKKFHRDGDIGADPEYVFYMHPEYCINNQYEFKDDAFLLHYGSESNKQKTGNNRTITGYFPESEVKLVEANLSANPKELWQSSVKELPVIVGRMPLKKSNTLYWKLENDSVITKTSQKQIATAFIEALNKVEQLRSRVILKTPDPFINTLGGALAVAADGIWEAPAYLHGAVAWRMHLNAWRGAYVANPLGWHDRAKLHFESYGNSQVLEPETGPVVLDSSRNFARQKEVLGTAMFSRGYISRRPNNNTIAHHYDMNSVFINQLLRGYQWTGDLDFMRKMWQVVQRHLAWEKRNFDADGDGLYDAYATIWASDALQYMGGGVTYASAYNYSANLLAASIAKLLGEDETAYITEAKHIKQAIDKKLWVSEKGVFAEYKDLLGNQLLHDYPGIWTIYHGLDEGIANEFQSYQSLRYIDTEIPHIPVKAEGLPQTDLELISTTNWQPYTWSVNNVALAENLHAALAYWQGGRYEEAYKLWESALIESMYLGASPGGFQQLSYYDAIRGELYRDFADPIGMAARSLVEGLFGINPDAIQNTLFIKPGLPKSWDNASLQIPDISIDFEKKDEVSEFKIDSKFVKEMKLNLEVNVYNSGVEYVEINGEKLDWKFNENAIGTPKLIIESPHQKSYHIKIKWKLGTLEQPVFEFSGKQGDIKLFKTETVEILQIFNPQQAISEVSKSQHQLKFKIESEEGNITLFVQLKQNDLVWWQPVHLNVSKNETESRFQNWDEKFSKDTNFETIDLQSVFNSKVTDVFEEKYLSPRPTSPTLQLPTQGIGNWCYPYIKPEIDDSGLRKNAGENNTIISPQNIPFKTPSESKLNNIAFVSQWDNFPKHIEIPLSGQASHAYFMMAGTTNPMQSRFTNGEVIVNYTDGTSETLPLKNPENWWPIEQDYFVDGLAFTTDAPKPPRVYFKTGDITSDFKDFTPIKGFSDYGVDGGAGTILDFPLDDSKTLKSLELKAVANDVVIGLMSVTLIR